MSHPINSVEPSTSLLAFNCPHCGAYTTQTWLMVISSEYSGDEKYPTFFNEEDIYKIEENDSLTEKQKVQIIKFIKKLVLRRPFLDEDIETYYSERMVHNINLSICYHCKEISIWVHDRLIYPSNTLCIEPNHDMPDIYKNYTMRQEE